MESWGKVSEEPGEKRIRRPSVRLGEIGDNPPSLALDGGGAKRGKLLDGLAPTTGRRGAGKGGVGKPPRIRPLEHVAGDRKQDQEGSSLGETVVVSPAEVGKLDQESTEVRQGSVSTSGRTAQVNVSKGERKVKQSRRKRAAFNGLAPGGRPNGSMKKTLEDQNGFDEVVPDVASNGQGDGNLEDPASAKVSSGSQLSDRELFETGEDVPADSKDLATSGRKSEANPNFHGDEIPGAIEDGPVQMTGKETDVKHDTDEGPGGPTHSDTAGENGGYFEQSHMTARQRVTLACGVRGWLSALGLGKYSDLFERNEVDNEVLPFLTLEDLREMGIGAVGARRKMFTAIQELGQGSGLKRHGEAQGDHVAKHLRSGAGGPVPGPFHQPVVRPVTNEYKDIRKLWSGLRGCDNKVHLDCKHMNPSYAFASQSLYVPDDAHRGEYEASSTDHVHGQHIQQWEFPKELEVTHCASTSGHTDVDIATTIPGFAVKPGGCLYAKVDSTNEKLYRFPSVHYACTGTVDGGHTDLSAK